MYKILEYIELYQKEQELNPIPIILCGLVLEYHACYSSANGMEIVLICFSALFFFFSSDWNGSKRGHVYKFLRSQGFVSSYDAAHQYTDSDADAHKVIHNLQLYNEVQYILSTFLLWVLKNLFFPFFWQWVSHRNHRGNICGVDFIWLLNPNKCQKPLIRSWSEAVFGNIKVRLSFSVSICSSRAYEVMN